MSIAYYQKLHLFIYNRICKSFGFAVVIMALEISEMLFWILSSGTYTIFVH